jgi:hypothetical protein
LRKEWCGWNGVVVGELAVDLMRTVVAVNLGEQDWSSTQIHGVR